MSTMKYWVLFSVYSFLLSSNSYLTQANDSKKLEGKIVGGVPVNINKFPSAVQLYIKGDLCAGSIVNSWTILTAAHCFDKCKDVNDMIVLVGAQRLYDHSALSFEVASFVTHEEYNKKQMYAHDIALLFVKRPIKFIKSKKAILVNSNKWMRPNETNFIVTGWGKTSYKGSASKKGLLMTHLRYVPSKDCARMHRLKLTSDMFCLYGDAVRDTCKGDSGGAVIWKGMVVGIISHGDGCAKKNKPSVYSNVWHSRNWIKNNIENFIHVYCKKKFKKRKSKLNIALL